VQVFKRIGEAWSKLQKLTADDGQPYDQFGNSVAISGLTLVVGSYADNVDSPSGARSHQGSAYVFRNIDADGDGLPDDWEQNGVTIEGVNINLPAMGADPRHKDIFIQIDWMQTGPDGLVLKPNAKALKMVTDAFKVAPVDNPDGKMGIRLHMD